MEEVLITVEDDVLIIQLNRPQVKNAANRALAEGVAKAVDEFETRDDLRVAIITGAGGTFCSGMDLKAFLKGEVGRIDGRGFAGLTEAPPSKPLIAAVEGYAVGGGFELALACDLIVASRDARFGLPEVKRGLVANAGGLLRLPRQMPLRLANELVLTGDMVSAEYLCEHGLINRIADTGKALEDALELARRISSNAPYAVRISKQVILESAGWSDQEMFAKQKRLTAPVFVSEDAREGATAFSEKRKPVWAGR